jgi:hypothetical protein
MYDIAPHPLHISHYSSSFFYQCKGLGTLSIWFISRRVCRSKNNNPVHMSRPLFKECDFLVLVCVLACIILCMCTLALKVLKNEKWGGLTVVSFDRSDFKLFTLKFSNISVQSSSCERHKTAQRTLFLLFANNNCFPKSDEILVALFEFRRFIYITYVSNRKLVSNVAKGFLAPVSNIHILVDIHRSNAQRGLGRWHTLCIVLGP